VSANHILQNFLSAENFPEYVEMGLKMVRAVHRKRRDADSVYIGPIVAYFAIAPG
jgi:hypothetical protein